MFYTTAYKKTGIITNEQPLHIKDDINVEMGAVNIYPQVEYQVIDGFGGAATEAAAFTWSKLCEKQRLAVLEECFGKNGCNYRFLRVSIDSCDFSLGHYQAVTDPDDTEFISFSLERDEKYVIPFIKAAEEYLGEKLTILLSPWSPPNFMKDTGKRNEGGKLKPECHKQWAEYICRYIEEYQKRDLNVRMLTLQNEPNACQSWDSCLYKGEEEKIFLRDYMYPALQRHGLDIGLYIWDHNKERAFERTNEIVDDDTLNMINGVAVHWYTGEHFDTLRMIRERYPGLKLVFTEGCVAYNKPGKNNQLEDARMYAHDIIGNLNNGMNLWFDWNLLLDQEGGPNHVQNFCDAPIMCDTDNDEVRYKLSLRYLQHFGKYIHPGAIRIGVSKYTEKLDVTAVKNPDGSIVGIMLNKTARALPVSLRFEGKVAEVKLPANGIGTVVL